MLPDNAVKLAYILPQDSLAEERVVASPISSRCQNEAADGIETRYADPYPTKLELSS
jgi:hypothetical protein